MEYSKGKPPTTKQAELEQEEEVTVEAEETRREAEGNIPEAGEATRAATLQPMETLHSNKICHQDGNNLNLVLAANNKANHNTNHNTKLLLHSHLRTAHSKPLSDISHQTR
jgi:hypothetical protein